MSVFVPRSGTANVHEPITRAIQIMSGFRGSWCLCGCWAVDAWLGRESRTHHDVDIAVFIQDLSVLAAHLPDWQLIVHDEAEPDDVRPWSGRPIKFPAHVHATLPDGKAPELEFCLNERADDSWILNRDPLITLRLNACTGVSAWGVATLTPQIVLFYKSKDLRPQDEEDFRRLRPLLTPPQATCLADIIARVEPEHRWLAWLRE